MKTAQVNEWDPFYPGNAKDTKSGVANSEKGFCILTGRHHLASQGMLQEHLWVSEQEGQQALDMAYHVLLLILHLMFKLRFLEAAFN